MYKDGGTTINMAEEYEKFVEDEKNMLKYGGFPEVEVINDIMYIEHWHQAVGIGIDMKERFAKDFSMRQYYGVCGLPL